MRRCPYNEGMSVLPKEAQRIRNYCLRIGPAIRAKGSVEQGSTVWMSAGSQDSAAGLIECATTMTRYVANGISKVAVYGV